MLAKKNIAPTKILLTLIFGYAALRSMRHVPLFAIVAIPILAEQVDSIIKIRTETKPLSRFLKWLIPVLLTCLILVVGLRFMQVIQGQETSERDTFPKAAVNWIETNRPSGNLFNSYGWGGYIIWRLYPQNPVFIDGRADVYGDNFIFAYMNIYRAAPGWDLALAEHGVALVLVEPESGLAKVLRQSPGWEIKFEDRGSVIFEKR
jgi:hypothetical protein